MWLDDAVRKAVDGEWRTQREIWLRHGYGAEGSTRKHLDVLVEMGIVERDARKIPSGYAYVYRSKA